MKLSKYFFVFIIAASSLVSNFANAQKESELVAKSLSLSGTPQIYSFEKIIDVAGVEKKALYDRVKNWIQANLKTNKDNIYFDEESYNSINATVAVPIKDFSIDVTRQKVEFKITFSFKDNKLKCTANSFLYYGLDGTGAVWQKSLEDLKPLRKKVQKNVYQDFDLNFSALIASMEKAAANTADNDW